MIDASSVIALFDALNCATAQAQLNSFIQSNSLLAVSPAASIGKKCPVPSSPT